MAFRGRDEVLESVLQPISSIDFTGGRSGRARDGVGVSMIVPGTPQRKVEKQMMQVKIDKVVAPMLMCFAGSAILPEGHGPTRAGNDQRTPCQWHHLGHGNLGHSPALGGSSVRQDSNGFDNIQLGTVTIPQGATGWNPIIFFAKGLIVKPSSSADFQKDQKVQSHPDAIQIHLEPSSSVSHISKGQPPLASLLRSNLSLPIRWWSHVFPRSAVSEFRTHHAAVLEVSAYYAGLRWWWLGRPVAPGGALQHAR